MEIAKLSPTAIKLKTKQAIFIINPSDKKGKIAADVVLLFDKNHQDLPEFEDQVLIVDGPGDYEVKGVKFSGVGKPEQLYYYAKLDGVDVLLTKSSTAQKGKENIKECSVVIIDADADIEQSAVAAFGATTIIFYGVHAVESAKKMGKEPSTTAKYSITKDKLPTEMEVVLLS